MKELKDYTTQELRDELKRRAKESRIKAAKEHKPEYLYWEATVKGVQTWGSARQYKYRLTTTDPRIPLEKLMSTFPMIRGIYKKAELPKVGDKVKLRLRYTNLMKQRGLIWWNDSKICEIIERT